jgi:hypothetical protein
MTEKWIIVKNWKRFQHPDVSRGESAPIWIRNYTRLLHDEDYLSLSWTQRGLLHGIWLEYAASDGRLPDDTSTLSRRLGERVLRVTLDSLYHAGFLTTSASKPPRLSASLDKKRLDKNPPTPLAHSRQTPNPNNNRKPQPLEEDRPLIDVTEACGRFIQGQAWDETFDEEAMLEEFQRIERGRRTQGTLGPEVQDLIEEWKNVRAKRYGESLIP